MATQIVAWVGLESTFVLFFSVLFQRLVRADPVFTSLHVLLARRPARRLRVCLGCYSQSASYPADIPAGCRRSTRTACNALVSQANELLLCDRPDSGFP